MPTANKVPAKKRTAKRSAPKSMPAKGKNPEGGLTAEGRKFFNKRDGSNLKPGVTGAADTPDKMRRKGSFLTRHFANPRGPMLKDGEPTRLALSAHAWGEPVPNTEAAAKKLAAKGRKLLGEFHATREKPQAKRATKKSVKVSLEREAGPSPLAKDENKECKERGCDVRCDIGLYKASNVQTL